MWTLPNLLTLLRILAVPIIVGLLFMEQPLGSHLALVVYSIAGITDFFDGYLARATGTVSRVGQFLDPIADKLMVSSVILMLVAVDWIAGPHVIAAVVILCRELLVSGLREFLAGAQVSLPVTWLAKWKTTAQMVALGSLVWTPGGAVFHIPTQTVGLSLLWLAALVTLYTGYDYLRVGLHHMIEEDKRA